MCQDEAKQPEGEEAPGSAAGTCGGCQQWLRLNGVRGGGGPGGWSQWGLCEQDGEIRQAEEEACEVGSK